MPIDNAALDAAASEIGDRWSLRVIGTLLGGDRTFGELSAEIGAIAPTILTARLRGLQRLGLVAASPYARRPVRMRYALTEPGRRLGTVISSLAEWGADREGRSGGSVHDACGTYTELRPWCPTCARTVDDATTIEAADELVWC